MDRLKKTRRPLRTSITKTVHEVEVELAKQDKDLDLLNIKLDKLNELSQQVTDLDQKILEELLDADCSDQQQDEEFQGTDEYRDKVRAAIILINKVLYPQVTKDGSTPSETSNHQHQQIKPAIKLPFLEIPTFSGNYVDWPSFHDMFRATIHNSNIAPAQKLQYLKNSLRGEAFGLLQSIDITDSNYDRAWNLLNERYNNEKQIIYSHLDALFDQPKMSSESAVGLRKLLDTTTKHNEALIALGKPGLCNYSLVYLVSKRLDTETRKQFEINYPDNTFPEYEDLRKFLVQRCKGLEASGITKPKLQNINQQPYQNTNKFKQNTKFTSSFHGSTNISCAECGGNHYLYRCHKFLEKNVTDRHKIVKMKQLCYNCLALGHPTKECPSNSTCRKCNEKHHTLIHFENPQKSITESKEKTKEATIATHFGNAETTVLLSTALIKVTDCFGNQQQFRALIDNGSQASFITEDAFGKLGLKRSKSFLTVNGLAQTGIGKSLGLTNIKVKSTISEFTFNVKTHILKNITGKLPACSFSTDSEDWLKITTLGLADPEFNISANVDILLGSDVFDLLVATGKIERTNNLPSAQYTKLGWIVGGPISTQPEDDRIVSHLSTTDIQDQLAKFWELEELPDKKHLTIDEQLCENHYTETHSRDNSGRYVVSLPFNQSNSKLGYSKELAIKRLHSVERRLDKFPQYRIEYNKFMDEFLELNHMEIIPLNERNEVLGKTYYMPHQFVLKESSTSTKFRVVFDASAKTTTGVSLNEKLLPGPRLQPDIFDIIIRFRQYTYVFTADISKFFRQTKVNPADADFQRVLWRNSTQDPIQEYRIIRVTYGTTPGPYLSSKSLQQLAHDEGDRFPLAKDVVLHDFYVDDVMTGGYDIQTVLQLQKELIAILDHGGFPLLKWSSNHPSILEAVPPEHRETQLPLYIESEDSIKALGLYWNPASDIFFFKVTLHPEPKPSTKRNILSDTARLYDPLGWLAPVVVTGKMLFQSLWKLGVSWDDPLPNDLENKWLEYRASLFQFEQLQIKRQFINNNKSIHQLHGFCDSSEQAYAAAVYVRSTDSDGQISANLICAKSKVAPVKTVSLPRLELCSAVLLAKLLEKVSNILTIEIESTHAWSDSTITLGWINKHPQQWTTFVKNRVAEIQRLTTPNMWNHVPSEQNPADCASRGISSSELVSFDLWWHGPNWLTKSPDYWPTAKIDFERLDLPEAAPVKSFVLKLGDNLDLVTKHSSLLSLQRVSAFCLRFINNSKTTKGKRISGPLTPMELQQALLFWIKIVQQQEFEEIISNLSSKTPIPKQLRSLNPFLDVNGYLRVGGRLEHSNLSYGQKHPMLLPKKSHLTTLIIAAAHARLLHGGSQLVLSSIQQRFWIINGRSEVRSYIRKCITCFKHHASSMQQQMGNLPSFRLEPTRPFLRTGVDFGGPFTLKSLKGRGGKLYKSYIALFVCFSTKAIHVELVNDLSTESFIASLKRFIARRGKPLDISSDNGTNFVGANNELKELYNLFQSQQHNRTISDFLSAEGVKWHFIPPKAPHHGGLWEAGIKSAKNHMKKVIGSSTLTYEEMITVLHQIEACLNSQPITPLSTDPNDLNVLTPGHFLIGDSLCSVAEPDLTKLPENRLTRWQLVQQQTQHFWNRWQNEYLSQLQLRTKWSTANNDNIKIDDLVLIKEDNLPPLEWARARVVELHPGSDNITRVVTLRTSANIIKRDIRKLCKLPFETC